MKSVLIIGGAHIDRKGIMTAPYQKGSSIPGVMLEYIGGSAFNIAVNLARLERKVILVSPRADEGFGNQLWKYTRGIPHFHDKPVQLLGNKPSYTALLDKDGELIAALADMSFYDQLEPDTFLIENLLDDIKTAKILITDGNLPTEILRKIREYVSDTCLWFAVATSPAKVMRYKSVLDKLYLLSMNLNEAIALTESDKKTDIKQIIAQLMNDGLNRAIITNGADPAFYFEAPDKQVKCRVKKVNNLVDVTGAGDATLSAFIASTLNGNDAKEALQDGLAGAYITIQSEQAQSEKLTPENLAKTREHLFQ